FPEITFAIAHCGAGFLRETLFLAYHTENIWVDTSGTNNWREYTPGAPSLEEVFRDLLRTYGPRRIMFGTDSTAPEEYRTAILAEQRQVFERVAEAEADRRPLFGSPADLARRSRGFASLGRPRFAFVGRRPDAAFVASGAPPRTTSS